MCKNQLSVLLLIILFFSTGNAQQKESIKPDDRLPIDKAVLTGTFSNGLRYFIKNNIEPQKRAELRLVVKAGSVLEDKDQLGLAHFVEHMAFNGTENFHKMELVNYLEKAGMDFGADINAYTSFDETVYKLQLPTDSADVFWKGFQVLEDWAHLVSFEDEEIDKERGVVIEEWRIGRGADARIRDKVFPKLFYKSQYAERLPIGKKELLETFEYPSLTRFYKDWYRPDLMAVIAVGDFDVDSVFQEIRTHFEHLKNPAQERERKEFPIPDHDETLFTIASDPEVRFSSVAIYKKIDRKEDETVADYRAGIVKELYTSMLNQRLAEQTQKANPPFLAASSGESRFVKSRGFYVMNTIVNEGGIESGLDAMLTEAERVKKYGFTQSELDREKGSSLRGMEQAFRENDKRRSVSYAEEYVRSFLYDEPIPGLPYEYELYKKYIPGITLEEVNEVARQWASDKSRVVTVSVPEKEGITIPTEGSLIDVLQSSSQKNITAYEDVQLDKPIIESPGKKSKVIKEQYFADVDITEWVLENGVKIVLKPTDFKNDQILFSAISPGGTSLAGLENLLPAETADALVSRSGVGNYNLIDLQKYLSDKVARVTPYIGTISEGFSGSASPQDFETMLQILNAYFTAPRMDEEAYSAFIKRLEAVLQNRDSNPGTAFSDTLNALLTQHDPREKPTTFDDLQKMNMDFSQKFFHERFADGNDFTFIFVGNFKPDSIKGMLETYLGSIPVLPSDESWSPETYKYPKGVHKRSVYKGIEPKSQVAIVFTGDSKWSIENRFKALALADVMSIKLRERLREDKGGTYGVGVSGTLEHYPLERYRFSISFGTDPGKVDELKKEVFVQVDSLKNFGTTPVYLEKVKESFIRNHETNLRSNNYWLNKIETGYFNGLSPEYILDTQPMIENLSLEDIHKAAQQYFDVNNYIEVVLYPQTEQVP